MQPWKISVGFTAIILAVAAMIGGERFAYVEPHFQDDLRPLLDEPSVAWRTCSYSRSWLQFTLAARALGLADLGLKVDLMERSIRRGGGATGELAKKLGQEERGQFPGV